MTDFFKRIFTKKFVRFALIVFIAASVIGTPFTYFMNSETSETVMPQHSTYFFVNDYSGVLSAESEEYLYTLGQRIQSAASGAQVVTAVVPNTGEETLESYSLEMAREWGVGSDENDNGVLILFTTEDPHVRIEVGRGMEGQLNDAKAGRILDTYAVEAINDGRWNEAAVNTYIAVAREVCTEYNATVPTELDSPVINETAGANTPADMEFPDVVVTENEEPVSMQIVLAFFIFWALFFIPYIIILFLYKIRFFSTLASVDDDYYGGGFGGGGFFGGSGGGGFSGGGGSFGGGGASR